MSNRTWIFPIAGKGERTGTLGPFKPFITINDKKILEWCLLSISRHIQPEDLLIFITTQFFYEQYNFSLEVKKIINRLNLPDNFQIVVAESTPQGPAASVYLAKAIIKKASTCIIVNPDQFISFGSINLSRHEAALPVYIDFSNSKSYVHVANNQITSIEEKNNISNVASAGVYAIASGPDLIRILDMQFRRGTTVRNEFYVGPAFNFLSELNYKIVAIPCQAKFDLGALTGISRFKSFLNGINHPTGN